MNNRINAIEKWKVVLTAQFLINLIILICCIFMSENVFGNHGTSLLITFFGVSASFFFIAAVISIFFLKRKKVKTHRRWQNYLAIFPGVIEIVLLISATDFLMSRFYIIFALYISMISIFLSLKEAVNSFAAGLIILSFLMLISYAGILPDKGFISLNRDFIFVLLILPLAFINAVCLTAVLISGLYYAMFKISCIAADKRIALIQSSFKIMNLMIKYIFQSKLAVKLNKERISFPIREINKLIIAVDLSNLSSLKRKFPANTFLTNRIEALLTDIENTVLSFDFDILKNGKDIIFAGSKMYDSHTSQNKGYSEIIAALLGLHLINMVDDFRKENDLVFLPVKICINQGEIFTQIGFKSSSDITGTAYIEIKGMVRNGCDSRITISNTLANEISEYFELSENFEGSQLKNLTIVKLREEYSLDKKGLVPDINVIESLKTKSAQPNWQFYEAQ